MAGVLPLDPPSVRPVAEEMFCYLTTTGRRTGTPHTIEIWFGREREQTIYLMAGARDRSDWVRNLMAEPRVSVRIGDDEIHATARVLDPDRDADEDALARRLLLAKYQKGEELAGWGRGALPVALDLDIEGTP
ncbi:MAG: nitroreductase family deazaflavin-dependent oxidoreductase [Actinobacteria bacterium]|nr:nitroreductase family deazaflavin-dependent oxidoreductase [Actinomycetota bacterium]MBV9934604.1 nitroreductase family deazaflavin-dependent oxidoreductase [Actinomycetota bacterium]